MAEFDLAIIGGGINGVGIARDAAGRGLKVLLVEQNDLASGTSSASTKLIHGGLRYLEHGALRLVREALTEREVLLRMAPHLVQPMRFVLPALGGSRPPWMLRLGLFVYDHLGGRKLLPKTTVLDLTHHPCGEPLRRRYTLGFEYSDCVVDDSRLVVANAIDAAARGAVIRTRTRCIRADRTDEWSLALISHGRREVRTARVLVNAAGPWIGAVTETVARVAEHAPVRLAKGSHIVVKKLFSHDRAYVFQGRDGRVVFAIPYQRDFTLIGTTDLDFQGDLANVVPTADEIAYLCDTVDLYFRDVVQPSDVVWAFAGVRSLHDDGSKKASDVTRDYVVALDHKFHTAPLLSIYGGKITTYRRLAESVLAGVEDFFVAGPAWTSGAPLPGGDFAPNELEAQIARAGERWPFLSADHARRLVGAYGTRIDQVLGEARRLEDLGIRFGADLAAAEVRYMMRHEWAETADDVLWRRSKLGLQLTSAQREALAQFMAAETTRAA